MERRDEPELSLSETDLVADEIATRRLLAPFGEPMPAEPPPGLTTRVLAALPAATFVPATAPRPRRMLVWGGLALTLLLTIGVWGVLGNSLGPASAAGGPAAGIGQLVLVLTLAAKPLVNLFANLGLLAALLGLAGFGSAWLWWRLVRLTPLALPLEARS